jgi:spectinomycin phosphotransferase
VRERPVDIRDSDVATALARQWALTVQDMSYLPVGFGGYHWLVVDQTDSRWFVTVSDLAAADHLGVAVGGVVTPPGKLSTTHR